MDSDWLSMFLIIHELEIILKVILELCAIVVIVVNSTTLIELD